MPNDLLSIRISMTCSECSALLGAGQHSVPYNATGLAIERERRAEFQRTALAWLEVNKEKFLSLLQFLKPENTVALQHILEKETVEDESELQSEISETEETIQE